MTECSELRFAFATESRREVVAEFNGGAISSDGGALLLWETERRMKLLNRFGQCFLDGRNPAWIEHPIEHLVAQRVYGLALGYEDLNDHEELRDDPLLRVLVGKAEPGQEALAGKSTLNRMELGDGTPNRYKKITFWRDAIDDLLVDVFLEAHTAAAEQPRSSSREPESDRAYREEDSRGLAGSEDRAARRFGLLPGRADGVVRS